MYGASTTLKYGKYGYQSALQALTRGWTGPSREQLLELGGLLARALLGGERGGVAYGPATGAAAVRRPRPRGLVVALGYVLGVAQEGGVPEWSNAANPISLSRPGYSATASRWDLRCWTTPHESEGQPQAFGCSLMSLWWPAWRNQDRDFGNFDHAGVHLELLVRRGEREGRQRLARAEQRGGDGAQLTRQHDGALVQTGEGRRGGTPP